jgi:transcriptional regulator with PAS, ATPase and Fis domain
VALLRKARSSASDLPAPSRWIRVIAATNKHLEEEIEKGRS